MPFLNQRKWHKPLCHCQEPSANRSQLAQEVQRQLIGLNKIPIVGMLRETLVVKLMIKDYPVLVVWRVERWASSFWDHLWQHPWVLGSLLRVSIHLAVLLIG